MLPCMIRILFLCLTLTACATFPQVDAAASKSAGPAPALLPMEELLAQTSAAQAEAAGNSLTARAAALRARAAALRRP
jgi:hypothetical protein